MSSAGRSDSPIPELAVVELPPELGRAEPDPEIQGLLAASPRPNLGIDFLPGALGFTLPADPPIEPEFAADVAERPSRDRGSGRAGSRMLAGRRSGERTGRPRWVPAGAPGRTPGLRRRLERARG